MLRYSASLLSDYFDHPILGLLLLVSALLFAVAGVLSAVDVPGVPAIAAGWFAIYGIGAGTLGLFGYLVLYVSRGVSIVRDMAGPGAS
ncbi:hypothetical protein [Halosimplex salinum]|uniref:hypothetical protein n=1 Tax=Halosimplex salinum TaxID=1710538 RepID=UPI000F48790C|nr:hypothetical protein [Halosimplex salinum]